MGSSGVVGFTGVRTAGRSVDPGSLGALAFAFGVVGFILSRFVHSGSPWWWLGLCRVVAFIWGRWVQTVSPLVSLCSSMVVGITQVRIRCRWVHPV